MIKVYTDKVYNVSTLLQARKIACDYVAAAYSPAEIMRTVKHKGQNRKLIERWNYAENGKLYRQEFIK